MKVIDFFGTSIKTHDISRVTMKRTKMRGIFYFFESRIQTILFILILMIAIFTYINGTLTVEGSIKFIFIGVPILMVLAIIYNVILNSFFPEERIIVLTLTSGEKIKSPEISYGDANALKIKISDALRDIT